MEVIYEDSPGSGSHLGQPDGLNLSIIAIFVLLIVSFSANRYEEEREET